MKRVFIFLLVMLLCLCSCGTDYDFSDGTIAYLNEEDKIDEGEYSLFLSELIFNYQSAFGDGWINKEYEAKDTVTTYGEYAKREALELAKMNHVLCHYAPEYGVALTDDELRASSEEAQSILEYMETLGLNGLYNLPELIVICEKNTLALKVYEFMTENGSWVYLSEEEKYSRFEKEYERLEKEYAPDFEDAINTEYMKNLVLSDILDEKVDGLNLSPVE